MADVFTFTATFVLKPLRVTSSISSDFWSSTTAEFRSPARRSVEVSEMKFRLVKVFSESGRFNMVDYTMTYLDQSLALKQ
jgi:hypothetical protein